MFGEQKIEGQTLVKIDSSGKIKLPKFTGAEPGEELMPMIYFDKSKIIIGKEEELLEKLMILLDRLKQSKNRTSADLYEVRRYRRYIFGYCCFMSEKVDKNGKIKLPSRALEEVKFSKEAYIVGNETSIHIYPNEEAYKLTLANK